MSSLFKNIIAVLAGITGGVATNMTLLMMGANIVPLPEGVDVSTRAGYQAAAHLLGPEHYIFPIVGHAIAMFVAAFVVAKMAATYKRKFALAIGGLFFLGGFSNVIMLQGAPVWFFAIDLILAYFPVAILAGRIATWRSSK